MRRAERLFQLVQLIRGRRLSTAAFLAARLDLALARHAEGALSKILAVLPPASRAAAEALAVYAPPFGPDAATRQHLETLRIAAESRHTVRLAYLDLQDRLSERSVRPLGCFYWGAVWTLAAWCESRSGFRSFRVDRIDSLQVLEACFRDEPGKTLADLFGQVDAECGA